MARRNRPNLQALRTVSASGNTCPPGWVWKRNDFGGWDCYPSVLTATSPGTMGPVVPPRHPQWRTMLAANPGPVDPFPYPGADVVVSMPVDPFARARRQHVRRMIARNKRTGRYSTTRRVLGL